MSLIADGVLIIACLTTAIYCFVLSRRLRSLSGLDEGIGLQIKQMNTALEEMRAAIKTTRASAKTASDRLSREVAEARLTAQRLNQLLQQTSGTEGVPDPLGDLPGEHKGRPSAPSGAVRKNKNGKPVKSSAAGQADEETLPEEIAFDDASLSIEPDSDPFGEMSANSGSAKENHHRESVEDDDFDDLDAAEPQSKKLMKVERMAL